MSCGYSSGGQVGAMVQPPIGVPWTPGRPSFAAEFAVGAITVAWPTRTSSDLSNSSDRGHLDKGASRPPGIRGGEDTVDVRSDLGLAWHCGGSRVQVPVDWSWLPRLPLRLGVLGAAGADLASNPTSLPCKPNAEDAICSGGCQLVGRRFESCSGSFRRRFTTFADRRVDRKRRGVVPRGVCRLSPFPAGLGDIRHRRQKLSVSREVARVPRGTPRLGVAEGGLGRKTL